ncbi:hypothetical protein ACJJIU_22285 (plasmid) [Microbulbifer sp. CnH-101-E]|uniref:hypothetical protein n=1 Tax=unclassified Microbulbifer TaxID=2619833 RepID=UPI004039C756
MKTKFKIPIPNNPAFILACCYIIVVAAITILLNPDVKDSVFWFLGIIVSTALMVIAEGLFMLRGHIFHIYQRILDPPSDSGCCPPITQIFSYVGHYIIVGTILYCGIFATSLDPYFAKLTGAVIVLFAMFLFYMNWDWGYQQCKNFFANNCSEWRPHYKFYFFLSITILPIICVAAIFFYAHHALLGLK